MDLLLTNKTALVSGSTAGIGLAIAIALAAEGAHVTINGRTQERVDKALALVREAQPDARVEGLALDLSNAAGAAACIEKIPAVDILINNLGIFEPKEFLAIPDEDWQRFFETNVMSGIRLSRHYLKGMLERDHGRIIFISSESAVQIPLEMVHYGFTKTAQVAIARGIAETTKGTGVTSNSILVGPTASEGVGTFVADLAKQQGASVEDVERDFFKHARPGSLLQRFATVEEIASMVTYVASGRASATNGAALRVEGGVLKGIL